MGEPVKEKEGKGGRGGRGEVEGRGKREGLAGRMEGLDARTEEVKNAELGGDCSGECVGTNPVRGDEPRVARKLPVRLAARSLEQTDSLKDALAKSVESSGREEGRKEEGTTAMFRAMVRGGVGEEEEEGKREEEEGGGGGGRGWEAGLGGDAPLWSVFPPPPLSPNDGLAPPCDFPKLSPPALPPLLPKLLLLDRLCLGGSSHRAGMASVGVKPRRERRAGGRPPRRGRTAARISWKSRSSAATSAGG